MFKLPQALSKILHKRSSCSLSTARKVLLVSQNGLQLALVTAANMTELPYGPGLTKFSGAVDQASWLFQGANCLGRCE